VSTVNTKPAKDETSAMALRFLALLFAFASSEAMNRLAGTCLESPRRVVHEP